MITVILALLLGISCLVFIYLSQRRPANYPPGPKWWPIVGNTSLLRNLSRELKGQHLAFSQLAASYETSVLGLKLGRDLVVVVVNAPHVREVLTREEFNGRPDSFFFRIRSFGTRRGVTGTDGALWQEQRAFTVRHLKQLGLGKSVMETFILEELSDLINLLEKEKQVGDLGKELATSILSVLWALAAGKRLLRTDDKLKRLLELMARRSKAFDMAGGSLNQHPWLRFIAPEKTGYNLLTKLNAELKEFLMEAIDEHKNTYRPEETRDLIDAFLHEMHARREEPNSNFTDEQLVMILLDLFIAGSLTTSSTLDFAFLSMIKYPNVQEAVYQEIVRNVGTYVLPSMAEKSSLTYTEAVLMEVQRLCHVVPITGPRRALKDTNLDGYFIPKDTTILISQWSVHRDEKLFPNPGEFRPERFLDENGKLLNAENVIPFGLGKRRCLGETLAKSCLSLFFAGIIQNFQISSPPQAAEPSLDPVVGITLSPQPYCAVLTRR